MLVRHFGLVLPITAVLLASTPGCTQTIREEDDAAATYGMTSSNPTTGPSTPGAETSAGTSDEADASTGDAESSGGSDESSSGGFSGAFCGDGIIQGQEECDCGEGNVCAEKELGGQGCIGLDAPEVPGLITGGVLLCHEASCRYDTKHCFYCGDGYINGNETCEPGFAIETDCQGIGKGLGEVSCGSDCQYDISECNTCRFEFDFDDDDCPGGWSTGRTTNDAAPSSWACGVTNGYEEGPGFGASRKWGTVLNGAYVSNESSYLTSPAFDLGECAGERVEMTIHHWFSFGDGDGGIVQVATTEPDDEGSWTTIEPVSGTFYTATVAASHPPIAGNAAFSTHDANEGSWVDAVFDITDYAGEDEFYIRFVFGSDSTGVSGGWYIDTLTILGVG